MWGLYNKQSPFMGGNFEENLPPLHPFDINSGIDNNL
jgi:hypothetical protein